MSQILGPGTGGSGGGIVTINGDSGSVTGTTVDLLAGGAAQAGATISFDGSGTTMSFNVTDANQSTSFGLGSGNALASGDRNTSYGYNSGSSFSTGEYNTAYGAESLNTVSGGSYNTAIGEAALFNNNANANSCMGVNAGWAITSGENNVGIGYFAFYGGGGAGLQSGSNNIALGANAGSAYTGAEASNICIGNVGVVGESNVIRIGTSQTKNFQAGIVGVTTDVNDAIPVLIDSAGQLGTVSSSIRYKQNIIDLQQDVVQKLRPVSFEYKKDGRASIGLIAEEVAQVMPSLVVYNDEGLPETIKYQDLPILLLAEIQKLSDRIAFLEKQ